MIWYGATSTHIWTVEVIRSTSYNVWIALDATRTQMRSRVSNYDAYFPTFERAKEHALSQIDTSIDRFRRDMQRLEECIIRQNYTRSRIEALTQKDIPVPKPLDTTELTELL